MKIELILTWSKSCVLPDMTVRNTNPLANRHVTTTLTSSGATFRVTNTKLSVPVFTLSTKNDKKLLEQLKSAFKRTVKWNKYRDANNQ